jgi:uncharacterized repeat protein (TIGR02543 family)
MTKAIKKSGLLRMLLAALVFIGCELSFQPGDSVQTPPDAGNNAAVQPRIILSGAVSDNNYTAEIYNWHTQINEDDFGTWAPPLENATIIGSGAAQSVGTSCTIPIQAFNGTDFSKENWYLVKVTQKSGAQNAQAKYKSVSPFDSEKKIDLNWTSMIDLEAKRFTVNYYANGNGGRFTDTGEDEEVRSVKVTPGVQASAYTPSPVRTGYTFDGWYTDKEGSNKYDFSLPVVTDGITLYANWIELEALESIDKVKEYLTPANFTSTEGKTEDNPIPLPVKLGQNTTSNNQWQKLLEVLKESERYVDLDLSEWSLSGKKFDPWLDIASGEEFVVSLTLPTAAESIADVPPDKWEWETADEDTRTGPSPFKHFTKLKEISGANITVIGEFAFTDISLKEVNFKKATIIGVNAFKDCETLTTVNIPNAKEIRNMAFFGCVALEKVDFPEVTTESIGEQAFQACTALTTANFKKAKIIGANAFNCCVNLTTIDFSEATIIGEKAFNGCALTTANFPKVTEIGKEAFQNSGDLEEVNFPLATIIGDNAFEDCASLTTVTFRADVILVSGIFSGTALEEANFPATTEIGANVFKDIKTLKKVDLSAATYIPDNAFDGCKALAELDIQSVGDIGNKAFANTGLTSLTITMRSTRPEIGAELFAGVDNATGDPSKKKKVTIKIANGASAQDYIPDWQSAFITYTTIGSDTAIPQIGHITLIF